MKKTVLLFALIFIGYGINTYAQKSEPQKKKYVSGKNFVDEHLKAEKNEFTAEFGLTGGLLNSDLKLNEGASGLIRGRYFFKENCAVRLGFNMYYNEKTNNVYDASGTQKGTDYQSSDGIILNAGIEKHFKGTNRLSPYVGGDILFGISSQKSILTNTNGTVYIQDFLDETTGPASYSWGLRALFGADYYFTKHVYLGAEAGIGFINTKTGKSYNTRTMSGVTNTITIPATGSSFTGSPSVITGIRIGLVF